ncbi:hypothetical protein M23134_06010 [Microscilla marina ATCC 23134]|uniref:Uncharacterized protein n=1 Tax=Microscilla marina ATCC 23134 TaxID=313606 RepID=A1ZU24_MICM2|nr:hypothetical protein M23134_06010 [Microscilla marina ATCC 23134]
MLHTTHKKDTKALKMSTYAKNGRKPYAFWHLVEQRIVEIRNFVFFSRCVCNTMSKASQERGETSTPDTKYEKGQKSTLPT